MDESRSLPLIPLSASQYHHHRSELAESNSHPGFSPVHRSSYLLISCARGGGGGSTCKLKSKIPSSMSLSHCHLSRHTFPCVKDFDPKYISASGSGNHICIRLGISPLNDHLSKSPFKAHLNQNNNNNNNTSYITQWAFFISLFVSFITPGLVCTLVYGTVQFESPFTNTPNWKLLFIGYLPWAMLERFAKLITIHAVLPVLQIPPYICTLSLLEIPIGCAFAVFHFEIAGQVFILYILQTLVFLLVLYFVKRSNRRLIQSQETPNDLNNKIWNLALIILLQILGLAIAILYSWGLFSTSHTVQCSLPFLYILFVGFLEQALKFVCSDGMESGHLTCSYWLFCLTESFFVVGYTYTSTTAMKACMLIASIVPFALRMAFMTNIYYVVIYYVYRYFGWVANVQKNDTTKVRCLVLHLYSRITTSFFFITFLSLLSYGPNGMFFKVNSVGIWTLMGLTSAHLLLAIFVAVITFHYLRAFQAELWITLIDYMGQLCPTKVMLSLMTLIPTSVCLLTTATYLFHFHTLNGYTWP